jgi:hypothetical protein
MSLSSAGGGIECLAFSDVYSRYWQIVVARDLECIVACIRTSPSASVITVVINAIVLQVLRTMLALVFAAVQTFISLAVGGAIASTDDAQRTHRIRT